MRVIINRIENNIAVCEIGGKTIDAPAELLKICTRVPCMI